MRQWVHDPRVGRWDELFLLKLDARSPQTSLELWEKHDFDGVWCAASLLPQAPPTSCIWVVLEDRQDVELLASVPTSCTRLGIDAMRLKQVSLDLQQHGQLEWLAWLGKGPVLLPSALPSLRRLRFRELSYRKGVQQLPDTLPALERLSIGMGRLTEWPKLPIMHSLRVAHVYEGRMGALGPIGDSDGLEQLKLVGLGGLRGLSELDGMIYLKELEISYMPAMTDLSGVKGCHSLEYLRIEGSRKIETLAFLRELPQVRNVQLFDCVVLDGDMSPLIGREVYFENRRHYSHTLQQVESAKDAMAQAPWTASASGPAGDVPIEFDLETNDQEVSDQWAARLPDLVAMARQQLADDPGESGLLYAEHHIAEIEAEAWESVHGLERAPSVPELLALLQPVSLWGDPTEGLHLDFTIGEELTQYVLSFEIHPDGTLGDVEMES